MSGSKLADEQGSIIIVDVSTAMTMMLCVAIEFMKTLMIMEATLQVGSQVRVYTHHNDLSLWTVSFICTLPLTLT